MNVLSWEKPKPTMNKQEWQDITADGAPPGVYTSNMSEEDELKWKAKLVAKTTDHPSVEIRKTIGGVQMKLVVNQNGIRMSMNGTAQFSYQNLLDMNLAIDEARKVILDLLWEKNHGTGPNSHLYE